MGIPSEDGDTSSATAPVPRLHGVGCAAMGMDVPGQRLLLSDQTALPAISWGYKWELYSIKIDSRVN